MKILTEKELKGIREELTDSREAFLWAFETARSLLHLSIPFEFGWREKERDHYSHRTRRLKPEDTELTYTLDICEKTFNVKDKADRARVRGFLEHCEMLEAAKKEEKRKKKNDA